MSLVSKIPAIIAGAGAESAIAVRKAEAMIEKRAKEKSRVDTGNMRRGWQHSELGVYEGTVYNLVYYTIHNEYGTVNMDAQPMLIPAVEETKEEFKDDCKLAWQVTLPK